MGNNVCCKACKNRFVRKDDWTTSTESTDNVTTESAPDPIQIHGKFAIEANAMFRFGDDVPRDAINVPAVDATNIPVVTTNTSDAPTTENNP
ncbi:hypothetical protein QJS10_CPB20g00954 [Acorus calamus]|uniref:Uncharacterized protein n=1 Tax=Acorus calamus TaxID=4465 RepID=A0AAV9CCS3_ACOCL|nr:hypothetical protein QJS10_CPB20g00954 [Acorus calamus]